MRNWIKLLLLLACGCGWINLENGQASAQEPNWYPRVLVNSNERPMIQATPMYERPYRPLHFYGNSVRRTYYRGTPVVMPRDIYMTTRSTIIALRPENFTTRR